MQVANIYSRSAKLIGRNVDDRTACYIRLADVQKGVIPVSAFHKTCDPAFFCLVIITAVIFAVATNDNLSITNATPQLS
jgi:hypothetical protein